jgi:ParB-like chromosome segregation protein Spo0J
MTLPRISKAMAKKIRRMIDTDPLFKKPMRWGSRSQSSIVRQRKDTKPLRAAQQSRQPRDLDEKTRYELIDVGNVLLKSDEELDEKVVTDIAESILVSDLFHPIAVRRIKVTLEDGTILDKILLVAGAHRLEAIKRLGRERVPCFFVDGDDIDAQLVRLGEDLWRKTLTVVRHAEKLVEYLTLASAKLDISGQLGQKSQFGRPPGGIALAARKLPQLGRSVEARRKIIARAKKISRITPEAKEAAIEAHLENNQEALLKIAEVSGHKAQLRVVAELAERTKSLSSPLGSAADGGAATKRAAKNLPSKAHADKSDTIADETDGVKTDTLPPVERTTTFDEMEALWEPEHQACWAYLPTRERERFIEKRRRARRKAPSDVVNFLKEMFQGRLEVKSRSLFGFAIAQGFGKSTIRKTLKARGYRYRAGSRDRDRPAKWVNPDRDWAKHLPGVSDAELAAAGAAQTDPRNKVNPWDGSKEKLEDYLADC